MYPHTLTRSEFHIRSAQPDDRATLEAIAAQTWDGDDYLPRVLDDWFNDPDDGFYVATLDNRVIGVAKVTRFAAGEWWLEGLRVDPAYQGKGVSRILHHFAINQVRQRGEGVIRFSTASKNEAVQALAHETGFTQAAAYLPYGADPLGEPVERLAALTPDDAARVQAWLETSAHFAQVQRSMEWDWSFYFLTAARLRERLAAGLVYGWPGHGSQLAGVVITNPVDKERWSNDALKIAYLDGPADELPAIACDVRRLAASLDRMRVHFKVLNQPDRFAALESAGYTREWDGEIWLYHRAVRLTDAADVQTDTLPPIP